MCVHFRSPIGQVRAGRRLLRGPRHAQTRALQLQLVLRRRARLVLRWVGRRAARRARAHGQLDLVAARYGLGCGELPALVRQLAQGASLQLGSRF